MQMLQRSVVLSRHGTWDILPRMALLLLIPACLAADDSGNPSLVLQVTVQSAPAGGWAQIKITTSTPALIASGELGMDLDPMIFGDVAGVAVYSATGDQTGLANFHNGHLDAEFTSASGGIGQSPGLPILTIMVPVVAAASPGATAALNVDPSGSDLIGPYGSAYAVTAWTDPEGNTYTVTVQPGTFTVGGSLSVRDLTPGGGLLPERTVLQVRGTGFTAATAVSIDGVVIDSTQYSSPESMTITLGAPTDLTGKHFHFTNPDGGQVDYFSALPSTSDTPPANFVGVHMIPSPTAFTKVQFSVGLSASGVERNCAVESVSNAGGRSGAIHRSL